MTTFKDKLKNICNYSEENKSMPPKVAFSYMEFVYENDELKREIKRKHRNLLIAKSISEGVARKFMNDKQLQDHWWIFLEIQWPKHSLKRNLFMI